MRPAVPYLFLGSLWLAIASCKKAGPELDPSLLLGTWSQQRNTVTEYNNQGPVSATDVVPSGRCLIFKPAFYRDSAKMPIIVTFPQGPAPSSPYTLHGTVLTLGNKRYEVRELTAHVLNLHVLIPSEDLPSPSRPLPAGSTAGYITDEYYTR